MWLKRALSYYMGGEHEECKGLLGCLTGGVHWGVVSVVLGGASDGETGWLLTPRRA